MSFASVSAKVFRAVFWIGSSLVLALFGKIAQSEANEPHCWSFVGRRVLRTPYLCPLKDRDCPKFEILSNEKWSVSAFAIVIASVSATVSAHKWTNLPCASFQIERGELIATVVYHQSVFCSLWMWLVFLVFGFNILFAASTLGTTLACKFHLAHLEHVSCCGKRKSASHPHSRGCFWGESAVS